MSTPILTEIDLIEAWAEWEHHAVALHQAMTDQVPGFDAFEPDDQARILAGFENHPHVGRLLQTAISAADRIEGHGKPSPLPMGSDEPLAETLEATTGLPFTVTTNGWRDLMHRELAAQGHGTFDPDTNRFEAPRDAEAYTAMMHALEAMIRPDTDPLTHINPERTPNR